MRLATRHDGVPCVIDDADVVIPLDGTDGPAVPSIQKLIETSSTVLPELEALPNDTELPRTRSSEVAWLAPLPRLRRNIFCVGKNYDEHAMEFARSGFDSASDPGQDIPEHPIIFTKAAETVIGPRASIEIPTGLTSQVDYEAELAVVIGTSGRFIPRRRALDYVFGFTMINDITARDLQKRHKQWFLGKSIETFCPMGPFIRTIDQIDLDDLILEGHVNGELRQSAPESAMIFDISSIISTISQSMMLLPGDVIATGTPAGVGIGRSPPVFLKGGDSVSVSATGLGTLTDPVVGLS